MKLALVAIVAGVAHAAPPPSDAEKLAAIQKAMNDLSPAVQSCWAAVAAAERFDIAGELAAQIDISAKPIVTFVRDTAHDATLTGCVKAVLEAYRWAPPLAGQSIQLPFRFTAPDGQSVIDRKLVPVRGQGKVSVAVLLDAATTGNAAASMFDVTIAAGGTTGMRSADRDELWYFPTLGATAAGIGGAPIAVPAGTFVFVPTGGARAIAAGSGDVHAVLVVAPGGKEGIARAGALPNREATSVRSAPIGPRLVATGVAGPFTAAVVHLRDVPKRASVHATELYYATAGSGTLSIGGTDVALTSTSAIQLPAGIDAAFHGDLSALQILIKSHP